MQPKFIKFIFGCSVHHRTVVERTINSTTRGVAPTMMPMEMRRRLNGKTASTPTGKT